MKNNYIFKALLLFCVSAAFSTSAFSQGDCDDLSTPVMAQMGLTDEPAAPFVVRAGDQDGRIFRDGIATVCPNKPYPGNFNPGTIYNWTSILLYNNNPAATCITINVDVDSGTLPCGTNGHGQVYQEAGGANMAPYDPMDQATNFVGDVGSSASQPFSVTVDPGWFEVVFTNTAAPDNCDFSFTIDDGGAGLIRCQEILGVGDNNLDAFTMSPNPSQGYVDFSFPRNQNVSNVSVYDVTGKLVISQEVSSNILGMSTTSIGSGIYFVKVSGKNGSAVKKLIVN